MTVQVAGGEQLWELTVEHSPVGTTLVAPDGRLLSANQALCDMLGYTEREIVTLTFQQITHPDDLAEDLALLEETLAGLRSSYRLRKRYLHADGHVVHGDLSVALLRAPDGTPIHFISQILDVTEAHEYAERLAETSRALDRQRRHLEAILDSVDVGVAVLDPDSGYLVVNRRHQQYVELAHPNGTDEMAGDIFTEDGRRLEAHELPSSRAAAGEEFDDLIIRVGTDPVTQRALSVSARSVRGDGGEFSGAVLAYADVTELVRALTAKDHFVASASHELRTPLTSVLGHLELLADSPLLPDELSDRVQVVQRNAVRLRELVADLLLVAQMKDGHLALTRLPVSLTDLVVEAADALQPAAQGAEVALDVDVPDDPVVAKVDGPRLRQVIDNLLSNAVKYTEPGGSISVRLRQSGDVVELAVSDTGIGVAPEEVGRLFGRFFRGTNATQRHIPGAGLGLSIVRAIVEAHGGLVTVDSTPGEGSTFRIELPVAP
ncbi:MAG: two-component system, OmpR family, phosphate regulon sensor histidine kinase PhoR [Nocardioidaceae bacterium]|nr:two-component system, OmpR family, phosphate regulon sensor histidine kinase PhoR [Nocardioidaceae bacterium]